MQYIITELHRPPLLAGEDGLRVSLAGGYELFSISRGTEWGHGSIVKTEALKSTHGNMAKAAVILVTTELPTGLRVNRHGKRNSGSRTGGGINVIWGDFHVSCMGQAKLPGGADGDIDYYINA